ncbi:hypothetical protein [Actinoallomurus sp. NPDC050550]|uniref:hypothetical protein n=1 Tax=Actinoallomurus sp. NPDC050550 TaxID=3154937 RepID=UPI003401C9BA
MDNALGPEEVTRLLDGMGFFQKRALKKAGFKWDGLHRIARNRYGAGLVEAVLACHTDLLGRPPRDNEPEKAKAAQRYPGVSAVTTWGGLSVSASDRGRLNIDPDLLAELDASTKARKKAEKEQRRRNPNGRILP